MYLFRNTNKHKQYWQDRKIDWDKSYLSTWNHPHRALIVAFLRNFSWLSLIEIGVGGGANIARIIRELPGRQFGGIDINQDAIELCNKTFQGGLFKVGSADNIMISDNSTDVVLSDMTLIYVGKKDIVRYIREIRRIARDRIVLCEFHSTSWWSRLKLKWRSGYYAYDYEKLLHKNGFYDICKYKLKSEDWSDDKGMSHEPQKTYAYIIIAKKNKYI